jgi:hypothetical protein
MKMYERTDTNPLYHDIGTSGLLHALDALPLGTHWIGGWAAPKGYGKVKILDLTRIQTQTNRSSSLQPVATPTVKCIRWLSSHKTKTKFHGPSPRANYTDRATAVCRRSDCQLLRIEGAMWSA